MVSLIKSSAPLPDVGEMSVATMNYESLSVLADDFIMWLNQILQNSMIFGFSNSFDFIFGSSYLPHLETFRFSENVEIWHFIRTITLPV